MESYKNLDGDQRYVRIGKYLNEAHTYPDSRDPSLAKAMSTEPLIYEHKHVATKKLKHLSAEQQSSLEKLSRMAQERGLLAKSSVANEGDMEFGLSDEVTLMYVLVSRKQPI
jgi:hypothetical protein